VRFIYPREDIEVTAEVVHFAEAAGDLADRLPASEQRPAAFYHDPCHLGRRLGVYDAPRRALGRVTEVREFSRNRADAECSGGGGLLPLTMRSAASAIARRRLLEAREAGSTQVVTACATCKRSFARVADGLRVADLAEVLAPPPEGSIRQ
jgi:Fe-S oxidoreductase